MTPGVQKDKVCSGTGTATEEATVRQLLLLARRVGRRVARRRRADPTDAESDALLGLVLAVRSFDRARGVPLAAWVAQQVRRRVIDGDRSRRGRHGDRRLPIPLGKHTLLVGVPDRPQPTPWSTLARHDLFALVCRGLSSEQARALRGRYLGGETAVEMARRERVTERTMFNRLEAAMGHVRRNHAATLAAELEGGAS